MIDTGVPLKIKKIFFFIFILSTFAFPQETDQLELSAILFHGNHSIPTSELVNVIRSKATPGWILKTLHNIYENIGSPPSYFDSTLIQGDIESLKNYYRDNGFFEIKVIPDYYLVNDGERVELLFTLIEGERYTLKNFYIKGIETLPAEFKESIYSNLSVGIGQDYKRDVIESNRETILTFLLDNGYMLATQSSPRILIDSVANDVVASLRFHLGKRYQISDIQVNKSGPGKDNVEDDLLRRLVGIKFGDYYSSENLNKGQVRLYRTNIFTSVLVNTAVSDTTGNFVPMMINSDIGKMHELSPEIILNNQASTFNFGLGLSYTKKNFFGDARNFTIGSSFAFQDIFNIDYKNLSKFLALNDTSMLGYLDLRASIEQPFLFGKLIRTKLEIYTTINKQKEYKSTSYGTKISTDFDLPKFVYFKTFQVYFDLDRSKYRFHSDYIKNLVQGLSVYQIDQSVIDSIYTNLSSAGNREYTTSILGFELGTNKTDNLLFPRKGYTLSINFEEANLLPYLFDEVFNAGLKPKSQFYKVNVQATWFPIVWKNKESAFGMKLRVGYMQPYKGSPLDIPFNSRFTAGGSNSVRGWRARQLIPAIPLNIYDISVQNFLNVFMNNLPVGGTFLIEGSVESRNRLLGPLGSAYFVDFGNTWNGYKQFRFDNVAVAVGFGLRLYTSFAPIRLDFGFKGYDPSDKTTLIDKFRHSSFFDNVEFHLGIGEAF